MWDRVQFENEMVPSTDALHRHWKRSCWVLDVWSQADKNTLNPKLLTEYGWLKDGGIVWDSDTNIKEVMLRVAGLLKGCGCKTGCQTQRCGCKRKNNVVKAVNAQIVQTLMIPLKLYIYIYK